MKALVVNALGRGFELEDIDIAAPIGREVLIDVQASGLCHTDLLFATNDIVPIPAVLGHEVSGIMSSGRLRKHAAPARDVRLVVPSSVSILKRRCDGQRKRRA